MIHENCKYNFNNENLLDLYILPPVLTKIIKDYNTDINAAQWNNIKIPLIDKENVYFTETISFLLERIEFSTFGICKLLINLSYRFK